MVLESTQSIFLKALQHDLFHEAMLLYLTRWQKLHKLQQKDEKIYKGFINGAAAFDLIKRGKYKAAGKVWKIYEKYRPLITKDTEHYYTLRQADMLLMELKKKNREILEKKLSPMV